MGCRSAFVAVPLHRARHVSRPRRQRPLFVLGWPSGSPAGSTSPRGRSGEAARHEQVTERYTLWGQASPGAGVTGFAPGDAVIVYGSWGCGVCANCRHGRENDCEDLGGQGPGLGGGHDGGMAECLLVPAARYLISLGALDPRQAAPLSDAGLTGYHAVKRSLHLLGAGSTAVVIGAGGLGQMTIQILRALSAATTVVAVDTDAGKLETAKRMGAHEALLSGDEAIARIKDITAQQGAQLVLDMVGTDPTLRMAAQVARVLGHLTIVGLGGGALPVDFSSPPHECSVASPYWGSLPELMEVITSPSRTRSRCWSSTSPCNTPTRPTSSCMTARSKGAPSSPPTHEYRRVNPNGAAGHVLWPLARGGPGNPHPELQPRDCPDE
ncbi:zinc-binding dehydrogenase [Streptomyces sp. NPDC046942]|uniref:zinc-binding dehydrogenase n=1 Tax=Streptomyces sp. NPDC046942 TaxID=3155137 RepID=UPI0033E1D1C3